jgi:hypothetical protein
MWRVCAATAWRYLSMPWRRSHPMGNAQTEDEVEIIGTILAQFKMASLLGSNFLQLLTSFS